MNVMELVAKDLSQIIDLTKMNTKYIPPVYNVQGYGAKGNGAADDTAKIQAAINDASVNGGIVYFPIGNYFTTGALSVLGNNVILQGSGKGSKIITNNATADIITLGDGTNEIRNIIIRDLCFDSTVLKTAGWAINSRFGLRCKFEGIWITAPEDTTAIPRVKNGIYFDRFDYCRVETAYINISGVGIQARGNADQSYGAGLYIGGGSKIYGAAVEGSPNSIGVVIGGGCGGVVFDEVDIIDCGNNVFIHNGLQPGINNREIFFTAGCTLDSAGFANLSVGANGAVHIDVTGTWIASSGATNPDGKGIYVEAGQTSGLFLKVVGARLFNNRGGGLEVNGGGFSASGCLFSSNGKGANGGHAINVANGAVTDFNITGNVINSNGSGTKGYGIVIASGTSNNYLITSNNIRGNMQGTILDNGGSNKVVANNLVT